jgi:hypothetical protein
LLESICSAQKVQNDLVSAHHSNSYHTAMTDWPTTVQNVNRETSKPITDVQNKGIFYPEVLIRKQILTCMHLRYIAEDCTPSPFLSDLRSQPSMLYAQWQLLSNAAVWQTGRLWIGFSLPQEVIASQQHLAGTQCSMALELLRPCLNGGARFQCVRDVTHVSNRPAGAGVAAELPYGRKLRPVFCQAAVSSPLLGAGQPELTLRAEGMPRRVHVFGLSHKSSIPDVGKGRMKWAELLWLLYVYPTSYVCWDRAGVTPGCGVQ